MNVQIIPFAGKAAPKGLRNHAMDVGFSYSMPFELPKPVRFFNQEFDFYEVGMRGQLRLGKWQKELVDNPLSMRDFKFGNILVPLGERLTTRACATYINVWEANNIIYIDFKLKDEHSRKLIYMYQIQFPVNKPNIVEFHYYHVQTGTNTLVGVRGTEPQDIIEYFNYVPEQVYHKTALQFDTTPIKEEKPEPEEKPDPTEKPEDIPGYTWKPMNTPFGTRWVKIKNPDGTGIWTTVWEEDIYRLQTFK